MGPSKQQVPFDKLRAGSRRALRPVRNDKASWSRMKDLLTLGHSLALSRRSGFGRTDSSQVTTRGAVSSTNIGLGMSGLAQNYGIWSARLR